MVEGRVLVLPKAQVISFVNPQSQRENEPDSFDAVGELTYEVNLQRIASCSIMLQNWRELRISSPIYSSLNRYA